MAITKKTIHDRCLPFDPTAATTNSESKECRDVENRFHNHGARVCGVAVSAGIRNYPAGLCLRPVRDFR
jgi:hypothetical protein